ncbi:MAG: heat-inducible transcriptional repressor HrcA [Actinomycetota bacterium]
MNAQQTLSPRKSAVLQAVVRDYVRSAEPVGSGTVAKRYGLGVSAATVRNEMAALEEMGYLEQPHTSAGRIPTDRGYRFFVDMLPTRLSLAGTSRRAIRAFPEEPTVDFDEVLRSAALLLSRLTRYAAVALPPVIENRRIVRAELLRVGSAVLLLLVGSTGHVQRSVLDTEDLPDDEAVSRASHALERALASVSYANAAAHIDAIVTTARGDDRRLLSAVAKTLRRLEQEPGYGHVFVGGASNIAAEDAFERPGTAQRVIETLEEEGAVLSYFRGFPLQGGVIVRIGRENPLAAMRAASVVTAHYLAANTPVGTVAVVGPTRMDYAQAMSTVGAVARRVSEVIGPLAG